MPAIGKDSSEDGKIVNPELSYSADEVADDAEAAEPEDRGDEANDLRFSEENELIRQQSGDQNAE
ncbi:hypothetical protein ODZ83_05755 [Acaricomes phytoseiuli]|uniref:hypothetical protein n=1 Tax=Acaricomes phytoseiuli TaxID=291968 RepID=UPI0003815355|nr:hypothetical protein [Acaricomes phytoseiuli]MCW1249697.1 hypothetical protein [Acaricomes phytoseiuli]